MIALILGPLLTFGLSILVHELGHFLAAKKAGIEVEKFSLGFGPKLIGFKRGETEYLLSLIFFFGGYVKMAGEEPGEGKKREPTGREFFSKTPGQRIRVVLAGAAMNFVLAILLYTVVFRLGFPLPANFDDTTIGEVVESSSWAEAGFQAGDKIVTVAGKTVKNWDEIVKTIILHPPKPITIEILRAGKKMALSVSPERDEETGLSAIDIGPTSLALIGQVIPGYPAEKAGLKSGDRILIVDGEIVEDWDRMTELIQEKAGKEVEMLVRRKEEEFLVKLTPILDEERGVGMIGINYMVVRRYPLLESFGRSFIKAKEDIFMVAKVMKRLILKQIPAKSMAGPVGIIYISGQVARTGIVPLLMLIAFINVNFAMINILPIPVADGGHLVLFSLEAIRGRPLSENKQIIIQKIGIAFLITLFVLITYNDIIRWIGQGIK